MPSRLERAAFDGSALSSRQSRHAVDHAMPLATGTASAVPCLMSILCESRDENIAEIVAEWKRLTDREPWRSLSQSDWVDHLPPLLGAMLDGAVCGTGSHEGRRRVIEAAMQHGEHRRGHGLPVDVLLDEHNALRTAVWQFLSRRLGHDTSDESLADIIRFDTAGTFAAMGSLRGYHRLEIEGDRDWAREIDRLVSDWEQTSLTKGDQAVVGNRRFGY